MLQKAAKFFLYAAIASPLIVNKSLFFPFITGKALFFRSFVELALVSFIGAVAFGYIRKDAVMRVIRQPLFIAVAVFTALFILTCFTAVNPSYAFWSNFERGEGGWQILHYFLFFGLLSLLFSSEKEWRGVMGWQVIVSSLVALYAVGQAVDWPEWIITPSTITGALSGTLGNPSYLGGYLMLSMALAAWLALPAPRSVTNEAEDTIKSSSRELNNKINWVWLVLAFFQFMVFFAAKNRASFIALGIGIIIMAVAWGLMHGKKKRAIAGIAAITILIALGTAYWVMTVKEGMGLGKENALASMERRLWVWDSAVQGIIKKPVFGWGAEHFPFIFDRYYNPGFYGLESWFDRAHNTFLEYATNGGIPLLLAYMAIFYVLYRSLWRMPNRASAWTVCAILPTLYLIYGLVLFETLPLYLILFLLLAFYIHYTRNFMLLPQSNDIASRICIPLSIAPALFTKSIILCLASLYLTIYLPFQKNRLIIEALQTDDKTDQRIFMDYITALSAYSPIGQQEAAQNLFEFTDDYINFIKEKAPSPLATHKIKWATDVTKQWYRKTKNTAIGVKSLYIYAKILIAAAHETGTKSYARQARALINEGMRRAPTRIEFVKLAMEAGKIEKDRSAYDRARLKGRRLRPDLFPPL